MDIEEVFQLLEIPQIKLRLKESRNKINELSQEIYDCEATKRDKELKLKFKETSLETEISNDAQPGSGKRKFSNDSMRKAEFIVRSAEDHEISTLRDDVSQFLKLIYTKKTQLEIELKYYEELILDYKLAITLANHLK